MSSCGEHASIGGVCRTLLRHAVAAFGPCRGKGSGEQSLARQLWDDVPAGSLVILDKCFLSYPVLCRLAAGDASAPKHWLIRAKSGLAMRPVSEFGAGDYLMDVDISAEARADDPTLPKTMRVRAIQYEVEGHEPQLLLTSLVDNRIIFRNTKHLVRIFCLVEAWDDAASKLPARLAQLDEMLTLLLLSRRAARSYRRDVKIKVSKYERNRGTLGSNALESEKEILK